MRSPWMLFVLATLAGLAALPALADPPVQVKIHEADKLEANEVNLPIDPVQHLRYTYIGNFCYGLYVDNKLLCCGDEQFEIGQPNVRIDRLCRLSVGLLHKLLGLIEQARIEPNANTLGTCSVGDIRRRRLFVD